MAHDIIDYAEKEKNDGAFIFLDQEEAFDRIEWGYLEVCLKKFGFGKRFINHLWMLYRHGKSAINVNGFITRTFNISRSMRQGCPVAAYLYILQAEPMAEAIRKSPRIQGIKLPTDDEDQNEARISMFADDTQLFHRSEKSINEGFRITNVYSKASGAKVNMCKTKGLYIGNWTGKEPVFKQIQWVENIKALGTVFGFNINYEEIWMNFFCKIQKYFIKVAKKRSIFQG